MARLNRKKTVYEIWIEDVQTVAEEEIGRELTSEEIEKIKEPIAEKIKWYDVIADAIAENLKSTT